MIRSRGQGGRGRADVVQNRQPSPPALVISNSYTVNFAGSDGVAGSSMVVISSPVAGSVAVAGLSSRVTRMLTTFGVSGAL